jgi:hypothetical protein
MDHNPTKPSVEDLREAYAAAVMAFNEASSRVALEFASDSAPSDEQMTIEQDARAVVVAARRRLSAWLPERETFAMILPSHITAGEWTRLRKAYTRALLKHAEHSAVLAARLAAAAIPTDEEFNVEESAALVLGNARREFWTVWRACKTTDVERSPRSHC